MGLKTASSESAGSADAEASIMPEDKNGKDVASA
jgi:hypothetical protein